MRWLQCTLFLLARSIEAENGSAATDVTLLGVEDALVVGSGTAMEENATGETSESHQGLLAYIAGHVLPFQSSEPEVVEVVEARARGGEGYTIQPRSLAVGGGIGWVVGIAIAIFAAANTLIIGATIAVTISVYKSLVSFLAVVSPPAAVALGAFFHLFV